MAKFEAIGKAGTSKRLSCYLLLLPLCIVVAAGGVAPAKASEILAVCADPNNLPFSNEAGEGFENKLAELVADRLGMELSYAWHAQRRGFLRQTLYAGECDVVMGTPHLEMIDTTRSYYRSSYVFVTRAEDDLDFSDLEAPELANLRIGVHLIGDDGANTPPAHALGEQGIVDNVFGFPIYGDYREPSPPLRLLDALVSGEIDVAAVWGPYGGYFAQQSVVPLRVVSITGTEKYLPYLFVYPIAMGVRNGDAELKDRLNRIIREERKAIETLLAGYGVPLL